jgi:hypothetical protein
MSEATYLPEVQCEVSEGLTGEDITVSVRDIDGREQYIHVLPSMMNREDGTTYLPVGIINVDRRNELVLVELPTEFIWSRGYSRGLPPRRSTSTRPG